jgi:murein DD-endopeptidase MepM/ murein hydrolase activator NlpD
MELQFHPSSGRGSVRTLGLAAAGERALAVLAGVAALAALSLFVTVPVVVRRWLREEGAGQLLLETSAVRLEQARVLELAASARGQALDRGDLLSRIAFLYGISPAEWPRALSPERGLLASDEPEVAAAGLPAFERGLERGRALVEKSEAADADLAHRVPAILPLPGRLCEPAAFFGPRVSPWTGSQEFFSGVELAAPESVPVHAAGGGVVVFAGSVRASPASRLWQLGNFVVISHGPSGATLYGHLGKVEVRRGQRVTRWQRLGLTGRSGWTLASGLHYEYWRAGTSGLRATDPFYAVLDERRQIGQVSLERMLATSAPGPPEALP